MIILVSISGKERSFILSHPDHEIAMFNWFKFNKICVDLKNMVPVQYITGESEFYGICLEVTQDTMIPRQETEELVDLVIKENKKSKLKILDIGTGTGCIGISLVLNMNGACVHATDSSPAALSVAIRNAKRNHAPISFYNDDILNPDIHKYGKYDIVVSNPPYITESEKANMGRNVLDYEPHSALFVSDNNPLIYYRSVLELCRVPQSVAEVSARLGIPLGVVRVLVDDLFAQRVVTVHGGVGENVPDLALMRRVLAGLHQL